MKVVVAHNRYRSDVPSGENVVVEAEMGWLNERHVTVVPFIHDSDSLDGLTMLRRPQLALSPLYARAAVRELTLLLDRQQPDVLHLHNPFPLISPWIVRTAHRRGIPVVQTVHNYRHVCAAGTFFRDGGLCHDCVGRRFPYPAILHACYRRSRPQSLVMATALAAHRATWRSVERYLVVSRAMTHHLATIGIREVDIVVKPNAVPDPGENDKPGFGFFFAGRLDEAKGVRLLLDAWQRLPDGAVGPLTIAGDGPLRSLVEDVARRRSDVNFVGHRSPKEVRSAIRAAAVVVAVPLWHEPFGLTVVEGMAHARPALVTDRGGPPEVIGRGEPDRAGWVVDASVEAVAAGLERAHREADGLRAAARRRYLRHFTPDVVMEQQISVYRELMTRSAR